SDPAASARSFASSTRGYARHGRSNLANCPWVVRAAGDETERGTHPEQFLRREPPSIRSTKHTEAVAPDTRQKAESLQFLPRNKQRPAPHRRCAPIPREM